MLTNAPDLIFVSLENWDDVWRRNQFLCAAYARRHPDARILFVGLPRDLSGLARRGRFAEMRGWADWSPLEAPGIFLSPEGLCVLIDRSTKIGVKYQASYAQLLSRKAVFIQAVQI